MLEIWWIRHAATAWNSENRWQGHTDVSLGEEGRAQARALGRRLAATAFDAMWSSDLGRCLETARLALPGREIQVDPRLRELPMGHLEGRTWEETEEDHRAAVDLWWKDPYAGPFPGGTESLADVTRRVLEWQDTLPATARVAAFTHGGVIRCCLWRITGPPRDRSWAVDLDNTSITRIRYRGDRARIASVNDAAHLELPSQG